MKSLNYRHDEITKEIARKGEFKIKSTSTKLTTLGCLMSFIVEISLLICSTILWWRIWSRWMILMATRSPVSVLVANLTLAKEPRPSVLPSWYLPTRVLGRGVDDDDDDDVDVLLIFRRLCDYSPFSLMQRQILQESCRRDDDVASLFTNWILFLSTFIPFLFPIIYPHFGLTDKIKF